jgi:hypothetical protein
LRQIFRQGSPESTGPGASPVPQTAPTGGGSIRDKIGPGPGYQIPTGDQGLTPTGSGGQVGPGGDILAQIMRELAKAIEEGRLTPVVVGPIDIGTPGQAGPAGQTQPPMGDIFGQILRDLLSGKGGQLKPATLASGMGSAVFGDRLELGQGVDPADLKSVQQVLDRFDAARR